MGESVFFTSMVEPSQVNLDRTVTIYGSGFIRRPNTRPRVRFGETEASLLLSAATHLVARVPEGAAEGPVRVEASGEESQPFSFHLGVQIADNLHPVANPAVDVEGNIYVTYSGQRGQKVPVSVFKIDLNFNVKPFLTDITNAAGDTRVFVSSIAVMTISTSSPKTLRVAASSAKPYSEANVLEGMDERRH